MTKGLSRLTKFVTRIENGHFGRKSKKLEFNVSIWNIYSKTISSARSEVKLFAHKISMIHTVWLQKKNEILSEDTDLNKGNKFSALNFPVDFANIFNSPLAGKIVFHEISQISTTFWEGRIISKNPCRRKSPYVKLSVKNTFEGILFPCHQ